MLSKVALIQCSIFFIFFLIERLYPARKLTQYKHFILLCIPVYAFATFVLMVGALFWHQDSTKPTESFFLNVIVFYFIWSFIGYWWHRIRHHIPFLWKYVHSFHHTPTKMEVLVTFFKHPVEFTLNISMISAVSWTFGFSMEVVFVGLLVESLLEMFHHSNIRTPSWLRPIGLLIQLPEMHLVHHQRDLHHYNYAAVGWDFVFGTLKIPDDWKGEQGITTPSLWHMLFFINKS